MKQLLVCPDAQDGCVSILVPKRRGEGFLKVPLGHHMDDLARVGHEIGEDLWGLDGSLDIQVRPPRVGNNAMTEWLAPMLDPIAKHYGMVWKVIDRAEFWAKHPIRHDPIDGTKDLS